MTFKHIMTNVDDVGIHKKTLPFEGPCTLNILKAWNPSTAIYLREDHVWKINKAIDEIQMRFYESELKPRPGDRCHAMSTEEGKREFANALVDTNRWAEDDQITICTQPYKPFYCGNESLSTSGGYFASDKIDKFVYKGVVEGWFWMWRDTPCGQGGMDFKCIVNYWEMRSSKIY